MKFSWPDFMASVLSVSTFSGTYLCRTLAPLVLLFRPGVTVSHSNSNVSRSISLSRVYICFHRTNHLAVFIRFLVFLFCIPPSSVVRPRDESSLSSFFFLFFHLFLPFSFFFRVRFTLSSSISINFSPCTLPLCSSI